MTTSLRDRVAIVTGGARGQGEAEARALVEAGARVVIGDVLDERGAALAAELGPTAHYCHLDVTSESDWAAAVQLAEGLGNLRILVNNAGIHWRRTLADETVEQFQRMLSVNLVGAFIGVRSVIEPMRRSNGGAIVNVSSTAGLGGCAGLGAYSSSKWALRGLTKTAALELGHSNIRVNSIHPGPVRTDMMGAIDPARFSGLPLQRCGESAEVAALVLFLVSDESAWITGSEFTIDGGSSAGDQDVAEPRSASSRP